MLPTLLLGACERLTTLLDLRECRYEAFPFDAQLPRIEPGRILLPASEPGIAPWSTAAGVELPVRFRGLTLGRFVLAPAAPTSGVAFSPTARAEAIALAARLGASVAATLSELTSAASQ